MTWSEEVSNKSPGRGMQLEKGSMWIPNRWISRVCIFALPMLIGGATVLSAQEAAETFQTTCIGCHTIGGGNLVGPDLKNVEDRQGRDWLVSFIVDPAGMLNSGDAYAQKILQESNGVPMPPVPGMTAKKAEALLDLIARESALEQSVFSGVEVSEEPFTPEDIADGEAYFLGIKKFESGAPACISCHSVGSMGGLGGGQLGVDLTKVYERLDGRKALASWLVAPATETMRPVFASQALNSEEITPLVAFFEDAAKQEEVSAAGPRMMFLLFGLGGAVLMFFVAHSIWSKRFRGVRRSLVEGKK